MNKILSTLGLCKASGNLVYGEKLINSISSKKAHLVLLAKDTAVNNKKKITDKTNFYKIELITIFDKEQISKAIGSRNVVAVGILDKNLAMKIKNELES